MIRGKPQHTPPNIVSKSTITKKVDKGFLNIAKIAAITIRETMSSSDRLCYQPTMPLDPQKYPDLFLTRLVPNRAPTTIHVLMSTLAKIEHTLDSEFTVFRAHPNKDVVRARLVRRRVNSDLHQNLCREMILEKWPPPAKGLRNKNAHRKLKFIIRNNYTGVIYQLICLGLESMHQTKTSHPACCRCPTGGPKRTSAKL